MRDVLRLAHIEGVAKVFPAGSYTDRAKGRPREGSDQGRFHDQVAPARRAGPDELPGRPEGHGYRRLPAQAPAVGCAAEGANPLAHEGVPVVPLALGGR
eukprot:2434126-Pyramimonas_sp.AAC.1